MNLRKLYKRYDDSDPLSRLVNLLSFEGNLLWTKDGGALVVIRYRGRDAECLGPEVKAQVAARIKSALDASADPRITLTQYTSKTALPDIGSEHSANSVAHEAIRSRDEYLRANADKLFSYDTHILIHCKAIFQTPKLIDLLAFLARHPRRAVRQAFRRRSRVEALDSSLEETKERVLRVTTSFIEQTADLLHGEILDKNDAFSFVRRQLNPSRLKADAVPLVSDLNVDYFASDSVLECHPDHLRLDGYFIKTLTLKQPPSETHADLLRALLKVSGDVNVVTEWSFLDPSKAQRLILSKQRHFHNTKTSMFVGVASERPNERDIRYDRAKEAHVDNLDQASVALETDDVSIVEFSQTVVLRGKSLKAVEQAAAEVQKVFGTYHAVLHEETYNGPSAFLATLPGGYPYNLRKLLVTNENVADLGCWFLPAAGEKRNTFLNSESLISYETEERSLFDHNIHKDGVGHTLAFGSTGSGKTVALLGIITHAQKYSPVTIIFDVGGSYKTLVILLGGAYIQVRPDALPFSINPFRLEPSKKNLQFLFLFFKLLIEHGGYVMNDSDDRNLFLAIQSVYVLEPEQRRLLTLSTSLPPELGRRLRPWTEGEQHGSYFDNEDDNVTYQRIQCIDFEGMERMGAVLEPLLFYLLYRADEYIYDPGQATTFKLFVADEAWKFFKHKVTLDYIVEALRTWRKKNAAVVLATQSVEDFSNSDALRAIAANCPTKLLFTDSTAGSLHKDLFGLTETEQERVRTLIPKRQFLLKQEDLSKVLNFNLDPLSYWVFTTNPFEAERRQRAIDEYGSVQAALEFLAGERK